MKKCDKTALLLFNVLALKNIGTNFIFLARYSYLCHEYENRRATSPLSDAE